MNFNEICNQLIAELFYSDCSSSKTLLDEQYCYVGITFTKSEGFIACVININQSEQEIHQFNIESYLNNREELLPEIHKSFLESLESIKLGLDTVYQQYK